MFQKEICGKSHRKIGCVGFIFVLAMSIGGILVSADPNLFVSLFFLGKNAFTKCAS